MIGRVWRPIPGYEGHYEVSNHGLVKSQTRLDAQGTRRSGRVLKGYLSSGYLRVALCLPRAKRREWGIHQLVMLAFVGPCPDGHEVLHGDGARTNNNLTNLSYGTRSENVHDSIRHGTNVAASKTHCRNGHEFTPANTYLIRPGIFSPARDCKTCINARGRRYRARKKEKLNESRLGY